MTRIEELVRKAHKAKGRYHTQLAMCDLYDVCGLPNFRPGSEPVQPECLHDETERLGAIWMHCTQCGKKWADDEIVPTTQPAQPEQEPVAWWNGIRNSPHANESDPSLSIVGAENDLHDIPLVAGTNPLAQPEQEPVAWWDAKIGVFNEKHFDQLQPLYTSPPQRQPLTNEQRLDLLTAFEEWKHDWNAESILIDMVEAAHDIGEKT
jgi:hypothetical protein